MIDDVRLTRAAVVTSLTLVGHVSLRVSLPHVEREETRVVELLLTNHTGVGTVDQFVKLDPIQSKIKIQLASH